jgi:hypothetical protein
VNSGGYWISPDGDIEPIFEHLAAVESNPTKYGLTPKDVAYPADLKPAEREGRREQILVKVMKNEWIRVRGHREYTTFEGWTFDDWFLGRIRIFLKNRHYWETDRVAISELSRKRFAEASVGELLGNQAATWTTNPPKRRAKR